jgi:hypothetical protein
MKKETADKNLLRILRKTTPYQRMIWLGKNIEFWKRMARRGRKSINKLL